MTTLRRPVNVAGIQAQPFQRLDAKSPTTASNINVWDTEKDGQSRYLVVSPYVEREHLLDLESLNTESQLLALSLTRLKCLREDYATAPYIETFNWAEIIATVRSLALEVDHTWKETSFYVVVFRSQIPPTTVYAELGALDKAAHAEATASGGFLKYAQSNLQHSPESPRSHFVAGTGLGHPMPKAATWRHASGDRRKTQGKEAWVLLIGRRLVQRGPCILSGRLTAIG
ncbi:hypothetical protein VTK56DRAFT_963 [Thermocarpiscus australiensis]